jgi:uncharacterized protein (TIGR02145 family)
VFFRKEINESQNIIYEINLSGLTWAESHIYEIMAGDVKIGELCKEFLHNDVVRRQTVVAYPMLDDGKVDLSFGLVVDNGYFVAWNPNVTVATPPNHILALYEAGEAVSVPPTTIYYVEGAEHMTTINDTDPNRRRIRATLKPLVLLDQRSGAANNRGQTTEKNTYGIVKIGTQYWIRENLRTTRYANGEPIPTNIANAQWENALTPGIQLGSQHPSGTGFSPSGRQWVIDANDPGTLAEQIRQSAGVWYNWHAITKTTVGSAFRTEIPNENIVDRISPEGWNVPKQNQFNVLTNYVYQSHTLPSTGSGVLNAYGTNESGFGAVGGDSRSNTLEGRNGSQSNYYVMDGYRFTANGTNITSQQSVYFQVTPAGVASWPAGTSTQRGYYLRLIRDSEESGDLPQLGELRYGSNIVTYDRYGVSRTKPVPIHYYIPLTGDPQTMPILFAMHGNGRNAASMITNWQQIANERQIMIFAPLFNATDYTGRDYHRGGVSTQNNSWSQRVDSMWTFTLIEHMFDFIVEQVGGTQTQYDLTGHSAGSQFAHRFMFFMPEARVRMAVTSNAGYYMIPTLTGYGSANYAFPYSLGETSGFTEADLHAYFAKNMVVHLGVADSVQDGDVDTSPAANAQSNGDPSRYKRGYFFFNYAKAAAQVAGVPFNWQIVDVPGVAHNSPRMAQTPEVGTADLLYGDRKKKSPPPKSKINASASLSDRNQK